MGVSGLWDVVLDLASPRRLKFQDYADTHWRKTGHPLKVGVDIYQWIMAVGSVAQRRSFNRGEATITFVRSRIKALVAAHVSFVFVFDGPAKEFKRRWGDGESTDLNTGDYFEKYSRICEEYSEEVWCPDLEFRDIVRNIKHLLEECNVSYVQAPADAETELARLNACGIVDALIINDGDALVHGARVLLRNFSKNQADALYSEPKEKHFYVTVVEAGVLQQHGLDRDRLLFFMILTGNDYSSGINRMGATKALQLALSGTEHFEPKDESDDRSLAVDFASMITEIYRPKNLSAQDFLRCRKFPSLNNRMEALYEFQNFFRETVRRDSKYYFGRNYTKEDENDYNFNGNEHTISMAFLPPLANNLFKWDPTKLNYASHEPQKLHMTMADLPQSACIACVDHKGDLIVKRSTGELALFRQKNAWYECEETILGADQQDWFGNIDVEDDKRVMAEAEAFVTRAIISGRGQIYVKKEKDGQVQVKYQPFGVFGLDKGSHTSCWMSTDRLIMAGGKELLTDYTAKLLQSQSPKRSPRRKKTVVLDKSQKQITDFKMFSEAVPKLTAGEGIRTPSNSPKRVSSFESPSPKKRSPSPSPLRESKSPSPVLLLERRDSVPDSQRVDVFHLQDPNTPTKKDRIRDIPAEAPPPKRTTPERRRTFQLLDLNTPFNAFQDVVDLDTPVGKALSRDVIDLDTPINDRFREIIDLDTPSEPLTREIVDLTDSP